MQLKKHNRKMVNRAKAILQAKLQVNSIYGMKLYHYELQQKELMMLGGSKQCQQQFKR